MLQFSVKMLMKRLMLLIIGLGMSSQVSAGCIGPVIMGECKGSVTPFDDPDQDGDRTRAYIQGTPYTNQFGQTVTLVPDGGGVDGQRLEITPNAYGMGIHKDQFGRPMREQPLP